MSIILFSLASTALMFSVVGAIAMVLGFDKDD